MTDIYVRIGVRYRESAERALRGKGENLKGKIKGKVRGAEIGDEREGLGVRAMRGSLWAHRDEVRRRSSLKN